MMPCPSCGKMNATQTSWRSEGGLQRRYQCSCGTGFVSAETVVHKYAHNAEPRVDLRMQKRRVKMMLDAEKAARRGPWG